MAAPPVVCVREQGLSASVLPRVVLGLRVVVTERK